MDERDETVAVENGALCPRCGCQVLPAGAGRHEAWHDFLESGIAELLASLASVDARDAASG